MWKLRDPPNKKQTYADSHVLVRIVSVGVLSNLLDDLSLVQGLYCHLIIFNKDSILNCSFILINNIVI